MAKDGSTRFRRLIRAAVAGSMVAVAVPVVVATSASATTYLARINFEPAAQAPIAGYTADTGQAFSTARGYGWEAVASGAPLDMTANTRWKPYTNADKRLSGMVQMQEASGSAGTTTPGLWEYVVPNGVYDVTVSVGDGGQNTPGTYCCLNSEDRLTVEGVLAINNFVPTATTPFAQATVTVAVNDGRLTIDPTGGVNTKINYVDIAPSTGTPQAPTPEITGVTPAVGATQVPLNSSVDLSVSQSIDPTTINATNFYISTGGVKVSGNYNSDAAGGSASFTPSANLTPNTTYTVTVTSGLLSQAGPAFAPYTSTFTTGTSPPPFAPYAFSAVATKPLAAAQVLTIGPDGDLYAGTGTGQIVRYPLGSDGSLGTPETIQPFGMRVITGLAFDPANPTHLWVTNNVLNYDNAPKMSGHISMLTVAPGQPFSAATSTAVDEIIGLPRSAHDHMTNGIAFGPDGKLYIAQGANTAYGSTDTYWGPRGEEMLSASILVADVENPAAFPPGTTLNVNTDPVGTTEDSGSDPAAGYDPTAANAPLKVFAYGTRNPFTLLWDNGSLYAPVNESAAGGNTPAGPNNNPPSALNVQAYNDYFTRIDQGKYYGHPNPAQGYYTLNGGNPTANGDPWEVTEYPVGVQPDPNWRAPDFSMGVHRSPDGAALYSNKAAFGGTLAGKILVSEYSDGDDLVAVTIGPDGKAVSDATIPDANNPGQALLFNNPIGVATDPVSGAVYVAEQGDGSATAGQITEIKPGPSGSTGPTSGVHVNFQPASSSVPAGYTADTGAAFNGQQGWTDSTGSPLNMTANTRARGSSLSPDSRYDTMILMQSSSGQTTAGQWTTSLANGTYSVTVGVGDATATNSVDQINAESGTANAVTIINHFQPTTSTLFQTVTKVVTVSDGALTLDATGGTNTKLDYVDIVPAGTDTTAPTASIALSGTVSASSSSTYTSAVQATVTATDDVGVTSLTYNLDNAGPQPYTAPFTVSGIGSHTIVVSASDAAGNVGTATSSFSITTPPPPTLPTSGHIDFGTQTSTPFSGYTLDYGQAYDATRGYGWEDNSTGNAASLVGNGRQRNSSASPDQRYDTFVQMQQTSTSSGGVLTVGKWAYALANGNYSVTIGVGDPTATNSVDTIVAQRGTPNAATIVNGFVPTAGAPFLTTTKVVAVSNNVLTLDPTGGTNTKIDYVDIVPAPADTTNPVANIALGGTLAAGSSTTYTSAVQVTASATDNVGVTGITYSLDGATAQPYTAPFTVSTLGQHTVTVSASDAAGNVGSTTSAFSITTPPPPTLPTSGHIDFGTQTSTPYAGYKLDYGQAYDATRGYGWEDNSTGSAASLVGNGRQRNSSASPDQRYDTFVQMQQTSTSSGGVLTVGRWEYALANGSYSVTIGVGDPTATNSVDTIVAERGTANATTLVNGYVPTAGSPFFTTTKVVTVSDGALTLDPTGGTNTKIDYVDIVPAAADTTPPVATIMLSGTLASGSTTTYTSAVQVSASATDDVGVTGTTYNLDNAGSQPYTAPFTVSGLGQHTVTVSASDAAGNIGTATATFTITTPPPPTLPTSGHVDFGTQTSTPPSGYKLDYGLPFDATRGYGWEDNSTGSAASLVGNGRQRNSMNSPDQRYDTLMQMQQTAASTAGVSTVGRWEYTLAPGTYNVTVAVGDATAINSKYTIVAERGTANATTIINGYVPTATAPFQTVTKQVTVTDGALTLDPAGGTNTKIDFVDITPVPDTTPPTSSVSLAGTTTDGVNYTGDVQVTVTAADETGGSGLASTSYVLDGGPATPYTGPFTVTADGPHSVVVTVKDNAGNSSMSNQSWNESHPATNVKK